MCASQSTPLLHQEGTMCNRSIYWSTSLSTWLSLAWILHIRV